MFCNFLLLAVNFILLVVIFSFLCLFLNTNRFLNRSQFLFTMNFCFQKMTPINFSYGSSHQLNTSSPAGPSDKLLCSHCLNLFRFNKTFVLSLDCSVFLLSFVLQALLGHTDTVTCLTASLAYHIIVSGSRDRTCIIWDLNKLSFLTQLRGHRAPVSALCINELTVRSTHPCAVGVLARTWNC